MRRLCGRVGVAAGVLVLTATTGCSADQVAAWVAWYEREPGPATEFANRPEVQADLATGEHEVLAQITNESRWDRIAACESGGKWDHRPVTNRTGTYSGGLMIGTRWWPLFGGEEFASQAWQATKAEQIVVAERIWSENGPDAWDCA